MKFCKLKFITGFIFLFTFSPSISFSQVNDPCKGDIIGKKAGSSDYKIPKNCDVAIMSIDTHDSLKLTILKQKEEIALLDKAIQADKEIIALKDSVQKELRGIIADQDKAMADYRTNAIKSQQLAEDCLKNSDKCVESLKNQKKKTILYSIVGTLAGLLVGFITGVIAA